MSRIQGVLRWLRRNDVWMVPSISFALAIVVGIFSTSVEGFWMVLEAVLLTFTLIYLMLTYSAHFKYFNDVLRKEQNRDASILLLLTFLFFAGLTVWVVGSLCCRWEYPTPLWHVGLPILSIACGILAGCRIIRGGLDREKITSLKNSGKIEEVRRARRYLRGYALGLRYSDIPTLCSLVILFVLIIIIQIKFSQPQYMEVFVAGIVVFHLMVSNFVFAVTSEE